jgi:hypothetical protein
VRLEQALRTECDAKCATKFTLCDCDRMGRTGNLCALCILDDLRRLLCEQSKLIGTNPTTALAQALQ